MCGLNVTMISSFISNAVISIQGDPGPRGEVGPDGFSGLPVSFSFLFLFLVWLSADLKMLKNFVNVYLKAWPAVLPINNS